MLKKQAILLIDDDGLDRHAIVRRLVRSGITLPIVEASNWADATLEATRIEVAVALIDIRMPDTQNAHMQAIEHSNWPIVVITGFDANSEEFQNSAKRFPTICKDDLTQLPRLVQEAINSCEN